MRRPLTMLLLLAAAGPLTACQSQPSVLAPVQTVGTPVAPQGTDQAPDDVSLQLAGVAVHTAETLGPALQQVAQLTGAYFDAKDKYTRYRVLSGPEGWEFRHGWYWRTDNTADRTLRAQFEDATGVGAPFDVTFDVNYGPEMHPGFPTDLTQLRVEFAQAVAGSGKLAASFLAPLPASRLDPIEATGSGTVTSPDPLGPVGIEALNAAFSAGGAPEPGVLVLKGLSGNATQQLSGKYNAKGLDGTAPVYRNGVLIGEVGQFDGQWQLRNKSGSYPIK